MEFKDCGFILDVSQTSSSFKRFYIAMKLATSIYLFFGGGYFVTIDLFFRFEH